MLVNTSFIKREYRRTQGISTTDITDKILNIDNRDYWLSSEKDSGKKNYYCTISRLVQFFDTRKITIMNEPVTYTVGCFDVMSLLIRLKIY